MIAISNADRDKIVEFLRAYAVQLGKKETHHTPTVNARRMALRLARRLEDRKPLHKQIKERKTST